MDPLGIFLHRSAILFSSFSEIFEYMMKRYHELSPNLGSLRVYLKNEGCVVRRGKYQLRDTTDNIHMPFAIIMLVVGSRHRENNTLCSA